MNLKGAWVIIPFSRGVHTKYEGEWLRIKDANANFTRYCWYSSVFAADGANFAQPYVGDLCTNGLMNVRFTEHQWPRGTKMDRGLNISFPKDLWLQPGESISAGELGRQARRRNDTREDSSC